MKHVFKLFAAVTLVMFVAVSMNGQTATTVAEKSETKKCVVSNCDITKCDPAMCDLMVKAGLCTKAQAEACKAKHTGKTTKVAAATMERGKAVNVAASKASCSSAKAKSCQKTCSKKKVIKSE
jgi:hypothetical protein